MAIVLVVEKNLQISSKFKRYLEKTAPHVFLEVNCLLLPEVFGELRWLPKTVQRGNRSRCGRGRELTTLAFFLNRGDLKKKKIGRGPG